MVRVFVIGDSHGVPVCPPAGYDLSIHLGDAVDAFHGDSASNAAGIAAMRAYDHMVIGNHDALVLQHAGEQAGRRGRLCLSQVDAEWLCMLRREPVKDVVIAGHKVRFSHYIHYDRHQVAAEPMPAAFERSAMRKHAKSYGLLLYGHKHKQYHSVVDGCHVVCPGHGARGEYAVVSIDGSEVNVAFGKLDL